MRHIYDDRKEKFGMELAVHMKNDKTGEKRIKKTTGKNASLENWSCKDFYYGSEWSWTGTEPWKNVEGSVEHIGRGYYRQKLNNEEQDNTSTDIIERLYSLVIKRFREEQPKRELAKSEQDGIWYAIHGKLCRGESETEVEEWCKTVPLAEEKPIHRPIRSGY